MWAQAQCPYGCAMSEGLLIQSMRNNASHRDNPVTSARLDPSLRAAWQAHSHRWRRGVVGGGLAVLLSGQVRTLPVHAEVQGALRSYIRLLGGSMRADSTHIFAALQRNCSYWGTGFLPTHDTIFPRRAKRNHAFNQSKKDEILSGSRDLVPQAEVDAALATLGAPYTVRYTSADELLSAVKPTGCSHTGTAISDVLVQWRGIALAYEMLLTHEQRHASSFRWVVRLRPDVCYAVPPAEALGLQRMDLLGDTSGCLHDDVYAVLPRWVASAYAATTETLTDCALDVRSCAYSKALEGALHGSLGPSKMPFVASMLRHGVAPRHCTNYRNVIVRPGNVDALRDCRAFTAAAEQQLAGSPYSA